MQKSRVHLFCSMQKSSSVARGGLYPYISLKSMQNSTFLVLLRPIFAPKRKTAPQRDRGAEIVKDLLLFGPEKWSAPKVGQEK